MRILLPWAALLIGFATCTAQEPARSPVALGLDDVIKLVRAGVTEELVIARIKRYNKPFDLNSDEILELKKQGVGDSIIGYLLDPGKPYTPPPPPLPQPAPDVKAQSAAPKDPLMFKIPPDPGMYWLSRAEPGNEVFEFIELKSLVPMRSGGKFGSLLTGGLMKGQIAGFLLGPSSKLRSSGGASVFYGRFDAKTAIEDLILLRMEKANEKRGLDFGPKPYKPVFPPEAIHPFDSKLLAEGLYRLDVPPLAAGEYVFLIRGTGDEKKSILGKGYDFGVDLHGKGR